MFDVNPIVIGLKINNVEVLDMDNFEKFVEDHHVEIVYICTSRDGAQDVADKIQKTKVKAIWNFAPVDLKIKSNIIVENIHLIDNLLTVSYFLKGNEA